VDIAEVARRFGVPASTLRFYEEKGLIASIGRRGLRRVFNPGVLERLALIAVGRAAGFSLNEIALMFAPDGRLRIDRQMLTAKAEELERTIHGLSSMRDGLRHLHGVSHLPPHPAGCCVWSYWGPKEKDSNLIQSVYGQAGTNWITSCCPQQSGDVNREITAKQYPK